MEGFLYKRINNAWVLSEDYMDVKGDAGTGTIWLPKSYQGGIPSDMNKAWELSRSLQNRILKNLIVRDEKDIHNRRRYEK